MASEELILREVAAARPEAFAESELSAGLAEREALERRRMGKAEVQMPVLGLAQPEGQAAEVQREEHRRKKRRRAECAVPGWSGCRCR